jgi:hypothetical protein
LIFIIDEIIFISFYYKKIKPGGPAIKTALPAIFFYLIKSTTTPAA